MAKRPAPWRTDATMPLGDHLRELRRRIVVSVLAVALGAIAGWYVYPTAFDALTGPYTDAITPLLEDQGLRAQLTINGVAGAFLFQLKLSFVLGAIFSSPIWLWQFWAFVLPALHKSERRWVLVLTVVCIPLFLAGTWLAFLILPQAISVLLGFTPESVVVLTGLGEYLSFVLQLMIAFGIAAQIPVVVLVLRGIGAVSAAQLRRWRPFIIVGIFIFAAAATPTADPWTMTALASVMTALHLSAEFLAILVEKTRGTKTPAWSDDLPSELE